MCKMIVMGKRGQEKRKQAVEGKKKGKTKKVKHVRQPTPLTVQVEIPKKKGKKKLRKCKYSLSF